jgi:enoyl-CoA hydratase
LPPELVLEQRDDGVLLVTLNRPEKLNALTTGMLAELLELWPRAAADRRTRAVVLTGAGSSFSAGHDLTGAQPDDLAALLRRIRALVYGAIELEKPVVAAVRGHAIGVGLALALAADVVVVAEDARLLDGQVPVGVTSGEISALLWPLLCGMAKAKYYLLAGEPVSGAEAERIGLATHVRPADEVLPEALAIAARLARGSQQAIGWTKRCLNLWPKQAAPTFELSTALEMLGFHGADANEARAAFREKRRPEFPSAHATAKGRT